MKLIEKISDRLLDRILPKASASAAPATHCYCLSERQCGPGGLSSLWCCDHPELPQQYICTCSC